MASPLARRGRSVPVTFLAAALLALTGCGERQAGTRSPAPVALAVRALADTARPPEQAPAPPVSVWLERVDRVKPAALDVPLPDAPPDTVIPEAPPPPAISDPALTPPVLVTAAPLATPRGAHGRPLRGSVELDVQVGPAGDVLASTWAGGSADSSLVRAATACARSMRFQPARRGDAPVAVWCRQRFDFGARSPR